MASRLVTTKRMSNTGYHVNGKPNWWGRIESEGFLRLPPVRGDKYLDVVVDAPPGTEVHCGAGRGHHKTVRQTVITTPLAETDVDGRIAKEG